MCTFGGGELEEKGHGTEKVRVQFSKALGPRGNYALSAG